MAVKSLLAPAPPAKPQPTNNVGDTINLFRLPPSLPLIYKGGDAPPGYWLSDVAKRLHPDDYTAFMAEVEVVALVDGEPIVYALDFVRWEIEEERR